MSLKLSLSTVVATIAACTFGLVHLERTAPLAGKPSVRLRVLTGDLPTADLEGLQARLDADLQEAKAQRDAMVEHRDRRLGWNAFLNQTAQKLQQRINDKQAEQWSAVRN